MEYWNKALETMPREELGELQFKRFRNVFAYAWRNSPAHRRLYEQAGLTPESLRSP